MFSPVLINVSLSSRSNHTPYNMSVCAFNFCLFSCGHFPGCSDFSLKIDSGSQRLPMSPIAGVAGGVTACVPLLRNSAPSLPLQGFRSHVQGGSWLGLCRSGCALLPRCALPARTAALRDACSACWGFCSGLCRGPLQQTPAEDLSCHFDCGFALFDSLCETAECLEICFEWSELGEYS